MKVNWTKTTSYIFFRNNNNIAHLGIIDTNAQTFNLKFGDVSLVVVLRYYIC